MARVKYLKSTLREVIFQLRFPNILRLTEEAPIEFQEKVSGEYPIYRVQKSETQIEFNGKKQQQLFEKNHSFINSVGKTKINLTSSFIAVSTLAYDRWEVFKSEIQEILTKFYSCYKIPGIQRVGLRYKNIVVRERLGLAGHPWVDLLDASVLGPLATHTDISRYNTEFEIKNSDDFFTTRHYELLQEPDTRELAMLLDCDYYSVGFFKVEDIPNLSDKLHDLSQKFIVESHKEALLNAMEPRELAE